MMPDDFSEMNLVAWRVERGQIVLREAQDKSKIHGNPPDGNGYFRYRSKDGKVWELTIATHSIKNAFLYGFDFRGINNDNTR